MPTNVHQWNVTIPTSGGGSGSGGIPALSSGQQFRAFLGFGLLRPFRRDRKQDFASAGGIDLIRSCVGQIIGTMCATEGGEQQGELPWRPEFGSLLHFLRHKKGVMLQELARVYIVDALARWEPRVILTATQVSMDSVRRVLTIRIRYNVIDQNVPGNNVILQDIEQTIDMPLAA